MQQEALTGPYVGVSGYSYATPGCTDACDSQDLTTLNANLASTAPAAVCVNAGASTRTASGPLSLTAAQRTGDSTWVVS
jgi:hypothetical protein